MAQKELFGEVYDEGYEPGREREDVLKGVEAWYKPEMQKARGSLSRRGFGRYHSPTMERQVYDPITKMGGETVRRSLTDLHFKEEGLGLQKRQMALGERSQKFQEGSFGDQMHLERQKRGQKVLCTALYRQGLLSFSHIKADLKFLKTVDKETHENYLRWAVPLVALMKNNKLITYLVLPFVRLWSGYMKATVENRRPPLLGTLIHKLGIRWGQRYKERYTALEVV